VNKQAEGEPGMNRQPVSFNEKKKKKKKKNIIKEKVPSSFA
jgi:hypothetical protein